MFLLFYYIDNLHPNPWYCSNHRLLFPFHQLCQFRQQYHQLTWRQLQVLSDNSLLLVVGFPVNSLTSLRIGISSCKNSRNLCLVLTKRVFYVAFLCLKGALFFLTSISGLFSSPLHDKHLIFISSHYWTPTVF